MRTQGYQWRDGFWDTEPDATLDGPSTLVLVFGYRQMDEDHPALVTLRGAYPASVWLGCSTAGEVFGSRLDDNSVTVAVARFESTTLTWAGTELEGSEGSFDAGVRLAEALTPTDPKAVLVLSEGVRVNGSELARGMNSALPAGTVIGGGLSGDGENMEKTWVLDGTTPRSGFVTAVALAGPDLQVGSGSRGGWDVFGPVRRVTRSAANVVYEFDGKPALELYKRYLGEYADDLPEAGLFFPLSMRTPDDPDSPVVRTILGIDESANSITFAGTIPEDSMVQLMRVGVEDLITGAEEAGRMAAVDEDPESPPLALVVSCAGRRMAMRDEVEEELIATLAAQVPGTLQVGFYSLGEFSQGLDGVCTLQNQTMCLTTLWEAQQGDR